MSISVGVLAGTLLLGVLAGLLWNPSQKEQLDGLFAMANEARQQAYETGKVETYDALGFEALDPKNLPSGTPGKGLSIQLTRRHHEGG